jgi:hypothetical protein
MQPAKSAESEISHKSAPPALPAKFPANFADDDEYADVIELNAPNRVLRWARRVGWVGYKDFRRSRQIATEKLITGGRTVVGWAFSHVGRSPGDGGFV